MPSPFDPRDVEVLAAALPTEGANPIGRLTRDVLILHTKRATPGNYSEMFRTGPAFRTIFFPNAAANPYEAEIGRLTGLDQPFFAGLAVAMLCDQIAATTSRLRPHMVVGRITAALATAQSRIRESSYRFYAHLAAHADSPIKPALAVFTHEPARATARRHYLAGLTSPTWVNDKRLQDASGNWQDRDWELYHHWIKLTALGATVGEVDAAITTMMSMGLPVPAHLGPGQWPRQAPWFVGRPGGADMAEATGPILANRCHYYPDGAVCMAEDNAFEFTANSQPGNGYRQPPSGSCFAPGTLVVMADATRRPIEDVGPGDRVHTPRGPRAVLLRPAARRGNRTLEQFAGTSFAFAATHPFLVDRTDTPATATDQGGPVGGATYAAADPAGLARTVPTLSQFGIRPLSGAVLLRHTVDGDVAFPAPATRAVPDRPELLYDLYLEVGPDGRSEYYAGDADTQVLVGSETPRFAVAPQTTAVVVEVLRRAGPAMLATLARVPDRSFDDLLTIGLDSMARTMMPAIGPRLGDAAPPLTVAEPHLAVDAFARSLADPLTGYDRRMGVLVELFTARLAPQFQAVLALPWRSFALAECDVTNILAVTVYSVELFRPGPAIDEATVEVCLGRGAARSTRRLPVQPGAPADRWYYAVDGPAYFPEWARPGQPPAGPDLATAIPDEDLLWRLEIRVSPDGSARAALPLPRDINHGYEAFVAPVVTAEGTEVGQALFDVRLLTVQSYASEVRARACEPAPADVRAGRLAELATRYIEQHFAPAVSAFRYCAATTRDPGLDDPVGGSQT